MEKRRLGKTGLNLSLIGIGGFHLVEIPQADVTSLLNTYLDRGGNYIETAASYGGGVSEKKIGAAVNGRRDSFVLASKTGMRTRKEALLQIETSLRNLRTDRLDIIFMHGLQTIDDADQVFGPDGSFQGALEAQRAGKVRFIGVTGHGQQDALIHALKTYSFDVLMTGLNYYDRFNFPEVYEELISLCGKKSVGLLAMKALADGYLYRSHGLALRYALSLPVASVVVGINTTEYLEKDLRIAENKPPLTEAEVEELYRNAPELGTYVCRLCEKCRDSEGFEPWRVFVLEGLFDRQMDDKILPDAAQYALRERLKHWFGQADRARAGYAELGRKVEPGKDYGHLNALCPYGIDIDRKLKIAHSKLASEGWVY